jgi:hypothetical protein
MDKENLLRKFHEIKAIAEECIASLGDVKTQKTFKDASLVLASNTAINFSLNIRAFIKRYAKGKSPAKKFVLIVAFLSRGKIGFDVKVNEVEKNWNKMTSEDLLGNKFNSKYPVEAKNDGFVNSTKRGLFHLTDEWKRIL